MNVYRLSKQKHIKDLNGTGARLYGGRWNPKGHAILYTSENKALAALEVLVHIDQRTVPDELQIITIHIPDKHVQKYEDSKFEKIIRLPNSTEIFQQEGKNWIESNNSLGLIVPSILIPGENNMLINPMHQSFNQLRIEKIEDFIFDKRFFIL